MTGSEGVAWLHIPEDLVILIQPTSRRPDLSQGYFSHPLVNIAAIMPARIPSNPKPSYSPILGSGVSGTTPL